MTIASGTSGVGSIFFADSDANASGYVQYAHSNNTLYFGTVGTERMRITANNEGHFELDGTAPVIKATASNGGSGLRINIAGQTTGQLFRVQEDGATKFQINENGNVGIANTSPDEKLEISGDGGTNYPHIKLSNPGQTGRYLKIGMVDSVNHCFESNGGSTYQTFKTASVERMRITAAGNMGIGTTAPASTLHVDGIITTDARNSRDKIRVWSNGTYTIGMKATTSFGGLNDYAMTFQMSNTAARGFWMGDSSHSNSQGAFAVTTEGKATFAHSLRIGYGESDTTTPGASYRLDVSGSAQIDGTIYTDRVAIGIPMPSHLIDVYTSTSGVFPARLVYAGTSGSDCALFLRLAGGSTSPSYVDFVYGTAQTGAITTNGSSTFYLTSSDYRLKENVVELNGALDRIDNLQPKRFNFIGDSETTVDGFLAHEVAEVVPEAIHGEKDAVNEDGEIIAQGIDQSKLVPLLVAAVQELRAEIEQLKTQINN